MLELQTVPRKGQTGRLRLPTVYSHELDRILERVFEQITDERSAAVQEYIDNLRAFAARQDNAPALAQVEHEIEAVTRRKDKLLDLTLAGALSNDEFKQRNETCNEQLAALEQQRTELQNADKTLEERIRRVENLRRIIEERWQMSCGFSREMSKRSLTISSWTRTRAKPVSRSIFSSPPVQSRSYLRRKPLTHSCK